MDTGGISPSEQIHFLDPYSKTMRGRSIVAQHINRYALVLSAIEGLCLDLGCGSGYGTYLLSFFCDRIIGIDLNREALEEARLLYQRPNLEFRELDLELIRLSDEFEPVDYVIALEFLEHLEKPEAMVEEIRPLLKKGGRFITSLPCASPSEYHKHVFHNLTEMKALLDRGFESVDIFFQFDQNIVPYAMKDLFRAEPEVVMFVLG